MNLTCKYVDNRDSVKKAINCYYCPHVEIIDYLYTLQAVIIKCKETNRTIAFMQAEHYYDKILERELGEW